MNKEFCTYEQALALKELGFDEPCLAGYQFQKATLFSDIPHTLNGNIHKNSEGSFTCAPLYQQAFRWFRKRYNLKSYIIPIEYLDGTQETYQWNIFNQCHSGVEQLTYEEAELDCLDKLIEIIDAKIKNRR